MENKTLLIYKWHFIKNNAAKVCTGLTGQR